MDSQAQYSTELNFNHEIRKTLNNIMGFSELALADNIPPKTSGYIKKIQESADSLLRIIDNSRNIISSGMESINTINSTSAISVKNDKVESFERPTFEGEVLVCDDSKMNQMVICDYLDRVGLKTVVANDGKEGVDIVTKRAENGQKPFDMIFMDIHMPEMDGLEATSRIIALGVKTPIIAITANVMFSSSDQYKTHGMVDVLGKPFKSQELWKCIMKHFPVKA